MNPLEIILFLTGGCFTLAGYITKRFPPKKSITSMGTAQEPPCSTKRHGTLHKNFPQMK